MPSVTTTGTPSTVATQSLAACCSCRTSACRVAHLRLEFATVVAFALRTRCRRLGQLQRRVQLRRHGPRPAQRLGALARHARSQPQQRLALPLAVPARGVEHQQCERGRRQAAGAVQRIAQHVVAPQLRLVAGRKPQRIQERVRGARRRREQALARSGQLLDERDKGRRLRRIRRKAVPLGGALGLQLPALPRGRQVEHRGQHAQPRQDRVASHLGGQDAVHRHDAVTVGRNVREPARHEPRAQHGLRSQEFVGRIDPRQAIHERPVGVFRPKQLWPDAIGILPLGGEAHGRRIARQCAEANIGARVGKHLLRFGAHVVRGRAHKRHARFRLLTPCKAAVLSKCEVPG